MSDHKEVFLMKSVLGKDVKPQNPQSVRKFCVNKAYGDMMSGGRYLEIDNKETRQAEIYKKLDDSGWQFDRALISDVTNCFADRVKDHDNGTIVTAVGKTGTAFGLSQKVVNMTFKYLYAFNKYINDIKIDFTNCDCPIDSVVLEKLKKDKVVLNRLEKESPGASSVVRKAVWSKLTKEQYEIVQKACSLAGSDKDDFQEALRTTSDCSRRLLYDFFAW